MRIDVTGKTIIFKNEYGYSTTISNKNMNGEYDRMYVSITLPKNIEVENKEFIEIEKGFLTFYKTKEGLPKIKIVVMECRKIDDLTNQQTEETETDLPF